MQAETDLSNDRHDSEDIQWIVNSLDGENSSLSGRLRDCGQGFWQGRSLAWRLFVRNLQGEFRQSLLGWLWIFLPALANAGVWVLLNSSGTVRISSMTGFTYAGFVFLGTVLWQGFTDGLMAPMNTLQANRSPLTKLPFPKEVFVMVSLMETSFDLLARSVVAIVLLALVGLFQPLAALLLIVLWGPLLIGLGVGAGLLLAPFGLLYKDVSKSLTMLLPVWMLLTPVIYPMPDGLAGQTIAWLNPPSALIHQARMGVMGIDLSKGESDKAVKSAENPAVNQPETVARGDLELAESPNSGSEDRVARENSGISENAGISAASGQPTIPTGNYWPAALTWGIAGLWMVALGTLWLRITSPIIIERLAN